jgi:AmpE protein
MNLLVIILSLLSERFLIHSASYQRFVWFESYCVVIKKITSKHNICNTPSILLACIVLPLVIAASVILLLANSLLWGLPGFVVHVILFYYCLGPQNPFYPAIDMSADTSDERLIGTYLAQVNNQLFTVIFWYIIAGPIVALLFRLISLTRDISEVELLAIKINGILEWIPARLTSLLYLLAGNFQAGFKRFISFLQANPDLNNEMLRECGLLAMRNNEFEEETMPGAERLIELALVILLVLIALCTLAAWL